MPSSSTNTSHVQAGAPDFLAACAACGARNRVSRARLGDRPRCGRCKAPVFPERAVAVSEVDFAREVEASPIPVLVDFWAPWCGPCRVVGPILEQIAGTHAGRLKVAKVNIDENPRLAARFRIQAVPTMVLFRDGAIADEIRGALPRAALEQRLAPQLG
jgi:thioredoxin 2